MVRFGFGVRYDDAYVYKLEQALQARDLPATSSTSPARRRRLGRQRNYLAVRDERPHDLVLYGLHLNDLIHFPTSYVAMAGQGGRQAIAGFRLLGFVARTLAQRADRNAKIRELTDPAQLQQPLFRDNMAAIEAMNRAAVERGRRFVVVILPILVDLRAGTFEPVYAAIRSALEARGIRYIDLSRSPRRRARRVIVDPPLRPASQRARQRGVCPPPHRSAGRRAPEGLCTSP